MFGGLGEKEYSPAEVYVLETEPEVVRRLQEVYAKHHAASMGVMNVGGMLECRINTDNNEMVSEWLDSNESNEDTMGGQPTDRERLFKKLTKDEFQELQREMFQKSLQQLVNRAFFQNQNEQSQRSSIVKSMLIKNKLKGESERTDKHSVTFASQIERSVNKSSFKDSHHLPSIPSIPPRNLLRESLKRQVPALPIRRSTTLMA